MSSVSVSRRAVAKGVAWAAPAVVASGTLPAFAASCNLPVCPLPTDLVLQTSSAAPALSSGVVSSKGTLFGFSVGMWNIPYPSKANGQRVTGYYLLPGKCGYSACDPSSAGGPKMPGPDFGVAIDRAGNKYAANMASYTPVGCSPQAAGAGLAGLWSINTTMPYAADACQVFASRPTSDLVKISVPVTVIYLNGLTPIAMSPQPGSSSGCGASVWCCYYLNMAFEPLPKGCLYANRPATAFSWTAQPRYT